jgi:hypothetical protein
MHPPPLPFISPRCVFKVFFPPTHTSPPWAIFQRFQDENYVCVHFTMPATCPTHLCLLILITISILGEELTNFKRSHHLIFSILQVLPACLRSKQFLSTLRVFSNILSPFTSLTGLEERGVGGGGASFAQCKTHVKL